MNDLQLNDYFNLKEFECPCCHRVMISEVLLKKLFKLRELYGKPINITSGYRCNNYNKIVGGVEGSFHKIGLAVDIEMTTFQSMILMPFIHYVGFNGIGLNEKKQYCHLDIRSGKLVEWIGDGK